MSYLSRFFFVTFATIAVVCATNWFVDPFGMYWSPVLDDVNSTKPASGNRVRITKAYRASEVAPEVLIVGNSRAEMGLQPAHPTFAGANVYNQAMPGAGVQRQADYALNTLGTTAGLKRIIMSVDYLDFLVRSSRLATSRVELDERDYLSRLPFYTPGVQGRKARLLEQAGLLFSLDSLVASIRTVVQQGANVNSIAPNGFHDPAAYLETLRHEGINALFVQKLVELNNNMKDSGLVTVDSSTGQLSPQHAILGDFLTTIAKKGVEIQLFISPYHISYLHLLDDMGMTEDFLSWKQNLLDIATSSSTDIELWDFSNPSEYILETVPLGSRQPMEWYWEPAHYRHQLGDEILNRLATGGATSGFGALITEESITELNDAHRDILSSTREEWDTLQRALGIEIEVLSN